MLDECNSISSQREILFDYVKSHSDFSEYQVIEFCDDADTMGLNQKTFGYKVFDRNTAGGYVLLSGVVQSKATGNLCIALLELDLRFSRITYCIKISEKVEKNRKFLRI